MTATKLRWQKIFSLAVSQSWLGEREASVHSLFEECDTDAQVDLLVDLLHSFTFLDQSKEKELLEQIVKDIMAIGVAESAVQIVALAANDEPDSSQAIIYALKPLFARAGWHSVQFVNQFSKSQHYVKEKKIVCLVDEFVGTGRTIEGRVSTLRRDYKNNKGVTDAKFFFFAYAGMNSARDMLVSSGNYSGVIIYNLLLKGISERAADQSAKLELMDALESKLKQVVLDRTLPRLGDGACEALYGRDGGNCPNSVFPLFWWPLREDCSARETILTRRM